MDFHSFYDTRYQLIGVEVDTVKNVDIKSAIKRYVSAELVRNYLSISRLAKYKPD